MRISHWKGAYHTIATFSHVFVVSGFALTWSHSASAQVEMDFSAEAGVVVSFQDDDQVDHQPVLGEVALKGAVSKVLDSGTKVGVNSAFRVQLDHPARSGFAGKVVACDASDPICQSEVEAFAARRGAFSRITQAGESEDVGARGYIEGLYAYADGGWGEIVLGRDQGIADRFDETGPNVFQYARSSDPFLDPGGVNIVRVINDISGQSFKLSYTTPRILGVRLGASYTPDIGSNGLDLDLEKSTLGADEPDYENGLEVGANVSRYLREVDVRIRASLTASRAESQSISYDDVVAYSAGISLERRDRFSLGVSALSSNNGIDDDEGYLSMRFSGALHTGGWVWTAEYATADDAVVQSTGQNWAVGVKREFQDRYSLSAGYGAISTKIRPLTPLNGPKLVQESNGILLEARILFE